MKTILLVLFSVFCLTNAHAILPISIYGGLRGGSASSETTKKDVSGNRFNLKDKPFLGANVGIKLFDLRGELEYIYRYNVLENKINSHSSSGSIQQTVVNVYYDVFSFVIGDLYVNAGLGKNTINSSAISSYKKATWDVGFGAKFSLLLLDLEVGYRYFDMGEIKNKAGMKNSLDSHDIYFGVGFSF